MNRRIEVIPVMHGTEIVLDYTPNLGDFGLFLDVRAGETGESWALAEIERKQARKLAKTILKMTEKK